MCCGDDDFPYYQNGNDGDPSKYTRFSELLDEVPYRTLYCGSFDRRRYRWVLIHHSCAFRFDCHRLNDFITKQAVNLVKER